MVVALGTSKHEAVLIGMPLQLKTEAPRPWTLIRHVVFLAASCGLVPVGTGSEGKCEVYNMAEMCKHIWYGVMSKRAQHVNFVVAVEVEM